MAGHNTSALHRANKKKPQGEESGDAEVVTAEEVHCDKHEEKGEEAEGTKLGAIKLDLFSDLGIKHVSRDFPEGEPIKLWEYIEVKMKLEVKLEATVECGWNTEPTEEEKQKIGEALLEKFKEEKKFAPEKAAWWGEWSSPFLAALRENKNIKAENFGEGIKIAQGRSAEGENEYEIGCTLRKVEKLGFEAELTLVLCSYKDGKFKWPSLGLEASTAALVKAEWKKAKVPGMKVLRSAIVELSFGVSVEVEPGWKELGEKIVEQLAEKCGTEALGEAAFELVAEVVLPVAALVGFVGMVYVLSRDIGALNRAIASGEHMEKIADDPEKYFQPVLTTMRAATLRGFLEGVFTGNPCEVRPQEQDLEKQAIHAGWSVGQQFRDNRRAALRKSPAASKFSSVDFENGFADHLEKHREAIVREFQEAEKKHGVGFQLAQYFTWMRAVWVDFGIMPGEVSGSRNVRQVLNEVWRYIFQDAGLEAATDTWVEISAPKSPDDTIAGMTKAQIWENSKEILLRRFPPYKR